MSDRGWKLKRLRVMTPRLANITAATSPLWPAPITTACTFLLMRQK